MPEVYIPGLPFVVHHNSFQSTETANKSPGVMLDASYSHQLIQNASTTSSIDGHLDYWVPVGIGVLIVVLWLGAGFVAALRACFFGSSSVSSVRFTLPPPHQHHHRLGGNEGSKMSPTFRPSNKHHHHHHHQQQQLSVPNEADNECCRCTSAAVAATNKHDYQPSHLAQIGWRINSGLARNDPYGIDQHNWTTCQQQHHQRQALNNNTDLYSSFFAHTTPHLNSGMAPVPPVSPPQPPWLYGQKECSTTQRPRFEHHHHHISTELRMTDFNTIRRMNGAKINGINPAIPRISRTLPR